jgi:hypothetical protein
VSLTYIIRYDFVRWIRNSLCNLLIISYGPSKNKRCFFFFEREKNKGLRPNPSYGPGPKDEHRHRGTNSSYFFYFLGENGLLFPAHLLPLCPNRSLFTSLSLLPSPRRAALHWIPNRTLGSNLIPGRLVWIRPFLSKVLVLLISKEKKKMVLLPTRSEPFSCPFRLSSSPIQTILYKFFSLCCTGRSQSEDG